MRVLEEQTNKSKPQTTTTPKSPKPQKIYIFGTRKIKNASKINSIKILKIPKNAVSFPATFSVLAPSRNGGWVWVFRSFFAEYFYLFVWFWLCCVSQVCLCFVCVLFVFCLCLVLVLFGLGCGVLVWFCLCCVHQGLFGLFVLFVFCLCFVWFWFWFWRNILQF